MRMSLCNRHFIGWPAERPSPQLPGTAASGRSLWTQAPGRSLCGHGGFPLSGHRLPEGHTLWPFGCGQGPKGLALGHVGVIGAVAGRGGTRGAVEGLSDLCGAGQTAFFPVLCACAYFNVTTRIFAHCQLFVRLIYGSIEPLVAFWDDLSE